MCNAPATFQRLIEVVLTGLLWKECFVYIDDVLVIIGGLCQDLHRLLHHCIAF